MWRGQIDAFTNAGYKLIIWDMRGHGRSSYPDDQGVYSEAHTVADMAALLDHVCGEGKTAIVGGLSLGGYMSQAFYRSHESRVESLLIIGMVCPRLNVCFNFDTSQILDLGSKARKRGTTGTIMRTRQQTVSTVKVSSYFKIQHQNGRKSSTVTLKAWRWQREACWLSGMMLSLPRCPRSRSLPSLLWAPTIKHFWPLQIIW